MRAAPTATVVVVARDRWSPSLSTLGHLLARTDSRHPVVVVDGGAPPHIAAFFDGLAAPSGRLRVVRRNRFLASNEARNLGADGARTPWIAFVENDCRLGDGWLESLLCAGEARDAASVYPAYLEYRAGALRVHGLGADLEISGPTGAKTVREDLFLLGRRWDEVRPNLAPAPRLQAEPHVLLIRREMLDRLGGLDEGLLGWFEHVDLALHHHRLGAEAWNVPQVECLYEPPPPVHRFDLDHFLLRWGTNWYDRSLSRLCDAWGLDPCATQWDHHSRYRSSVLRAALPGPAIVGPLTELATRPLARRAADRWNRLDTAERK